MATCWTGPPWRQARISGAPCRAASACAAACSTAAARPVPRIAACSVCRASIGRSSVQLHCSQGPSPQHPARSGILHADAASAPVPLVVAWARVQARDAQAPPPLLPRAAAQRQLQPPGVCGAGALCNTPEAHRPAPSRDNVGDAVNTSIQPHISLPSLSATHARAVAVISCPVLAVVAGADAGLEGTTSCSALHSHSQHLTAFSAALQCFPRAALCRCR